MLASRTLTSTLSSPPSSHALASSVHLSTLTTSSAKTRQGAQIWESDFVRERSMVWSSDGVRLSALRWRCERGREWQQGRNNREREREVRFWEVRGWEWEVRTGRGGERGGHAVENWGRELWGAPLRWEREREKWDSDKREWDERETGFEDF